MPSDPNPAGLEDGCAAYQVVGGVTDPLAEDGYGLWEKSPGDGF